MNTVAFSLPAATLRALLRNVEAALPPDSYQRPACQGVLFVVDWTRLKLTVTDGRRLHIAEVNAGVPIHIGTRFILPKAAVPALHRLLRRQPKGETILVEVVSGGVTFHGIDKVKSATIKDTFPNYDHIIPNNTARWAARWVDVPVADFLAALYYVKPWCQQWVRITFTKHVAVLQPDNSSWTNNSAQFVVAYKEDQLYEVKINPKYLIDALLPHRKAMKHRDYLYPVNLWFNMATEPVAITAKTTTANHNITTTAVIQPLFI